MSNFSDRELINAIYDVRDRVTRIEEKLNRTEGLSEKVDSAEDKSMEALLKTVQLEKEISQMKNNTKWAMGLVFTFIGGIVIALMQVFLSR